MPKASSLKSSIPLIYRKEWLDLMVFGYLEGAKDHCTMTEQDLIRELLEKLGEDGLPHTEIKTLLKNYLRTKEQLREYLKHKSSIDHSKDKGANMVEAAKDLSFIINNKSFITQLKAVSELMGEGNSFKSILESINKFNNIYKNI